MEYLYLTKEQNDMLDKVTESNASNMILKASEYQDGYILNAEVLDEPLFDFYKPLLLSLQKITIE